MGHNVIAQTLFDSIPMSEQARFMAARFYLQIFNGDPDFYHYKTKEHDKLKMVAFLFLFRRELLGIKDPLSSSNPIVQSTLATNTKAKAKVDRKILEQPDELGPIVFRRKKRSEWQPQIAGWEYTDEALFELLSNDVFQAKMTVDQVGA